LSILDSSEELKALVKQYFESIWRDEIQRDFDDEIKYIDGKRHQYPRPQSEIEQIMSQIEHYSSLVTDECIESFNDSGIANANQFYDNWKRGSEIAQSIQVKYRQRFQVYVRGQLTSKE